MKTIIVFLVVLLSQGAYSQITLDIQTSYTLVYFKLNDSQTKYYKSDYLLIDSTNQLLLYNLDGSLYKNIELPPNPNSLIVYIDWISESLFDNNPSNIELLVFYLVDSASVPQYQARVIREDGTILLDEMNARSFFYNNFSYMTPLVYATEEGPKLMLDYQYANGPYYQTKVFNLPGEIPAGVKYNQQEMTNKLSLYPNPNNGSFIIDFHSNSGNSHIIDLYSVNGTLIDSFISSSKLFHFNNSGLSDGVYIINARSNSTNSTTKMIIKK